MGRWWRSSSLHRRRTESTHGGPSHATKLKASGSASTTELWFEPRQPEDLFAPLAHSAASCSPRVDRNRVRKCGQCVLHFPRHKQERDTTLVQHATVWKPPQGRCLRCSPRESSQVMRMTFGRIVDCRSVSRSEGGPRPSFHIFRK